MTTLVPLRAAQRLHRRVAASSAISNAACLRLRVRAGGPRALAVAKSILSGGNIPDGRRTATITTIRCRRRPRRRR